MTPKRLKAWILSGLSSYSERFRLPLLRQDGGGPTSIAPPCEVDTLRDSLDPSLKRDVFRNHIVYINRGHYSDPGALGAFPKATHIDQTQLTAVWNTRQPADGTGQATEHLGSKSTAKRPEWPGELI